jgi:hypothetical protein
MRARSRELTQPLSLSLSFLSFNARGRGFSRAPPKVRARAQVRNKCQVTIFLIKRLGFFEKRHPTPVFGEGQRFVFAVPPAREIPRARRIFRAKKRRGVIIPCIAADSFDAHTHTPRESSINIRIYIRARERDGRRILDREIRFR